MPNAKTNQILYGIMSVWFSVNPSHRNKSNITIAATALDQHHHNVRMKVQKMWVLHLPRRTIERVSIWLTEENQIWRAKVNFSIWEAKGFQISSLTDTYVLIFKKQKTYWGNCTKKRKNTAKQQALSNLSKKERSVKCFSDNS